MYCHVPVLNDQTSNDTYDKNPGNNSSIMWMVLQLTCGHHVADGGKLHESVVVGQDCVYRQLIHTAADIRLLAQVSEAGHGHQHGLGIWTPQK